MTKPIYATISGLRVMLMGDNGSTRVLLITPQTGTLELCTDQNADLAMQRATYLIEKHNISTNEDASE